jgi:NAD-dependent SIR2 family protein deacetylase
MPRVCLACGVQALLDRPMTLRPRRIGAIVRRMIESLASLIRGRRTVVLSGAGISTESGIPDYRGPETRRRARTPIQYSAFVGSEAARRRYWARATAGWPRIAEAAPNAGHHAVAELEAAGIVQGVITQNVDRLHTRAGSRRVIELHGALQEVVCLACGALEDRDAVHARALLLNPAFDARALQEIAPDGDAELDQDAARAFVVPACERCGGVLKPNVVYFGENVPRARVEAAYALQDEGEVLLVLGSSLAVFSGYRFVLRAAERGMPIAIVNLDASRGDAHAALRLGLPLGRSLRELVTRLIPAR